MDIMRNTFNYSLNPPLKIGILMPIYNGDEYFEEAFLSILKQTYNNWELWIGINGHPKGSDVYNRILNIIKPFANKRDIVLLDFGLPGNKAATLNKLVKLISKNIKYVALLDVDDIWHPNKLELQLPLLQIRYPYHIVGGKCEYFGIDTEGKIIPENITSNIPVGDFSKKYNFKYRNPIINSSVIIHIDLAVWNENTTNGLEDYELWLNLRKRGDVKFYNIDKVLIKHRIHNSSAFNTNNNNHLIELLAKY
jgi:teichuronic acid biosynthesis glycosyltransferase TuaG